MFMCNFFVTLFNSNSSFCSLIHFTSMSFPLPKMSENFSFHPSKICLCHGNQMNNSKRQQITWWKFLTLHHMAKGKPFNLTSPRILSWRYILMLLLHGHHRWSVYGGHRERDSFFKKLRFCITMSKSIWNFYLRTP